jgi:hypothetical protein
LPRSIRKELSRYLCTEYALVGEDAKAVAASRLEEAGTVQHAEGPLHFWKYVLPGSRVGWVTVLESADCYRLGTSSTGPDGKPADRMPRSALIEIRGGGPKDKLPPIRRIELETEDGETWYSETVVALPSGDECEVVLEMTFEEQRLIIACIAVLYLGRGTSLRCASSAQLAVPCGVFECFVELG